MRILKPRNHKSSAALAIVRCDRGTQIVTDIIVENHSPESCQCSVNNVTQNHIGPGPYQPMIILTEDNTN